MTKLTDVDMRALDRAVDAACLDPAEKTRVDARFAAGKAWIDVAIDCARHLQYRNLELRPWESPPMYGDIDRPRLDQHDSELLGRLLAAGLSRYESDPLRALERATALQKVPAK